MLAFCFMSTGDVNNAGAWAKFFSGGLFGINYILLMHRSDGSLLPSIIPGMQIIDHIPEAVNAWGKFPLLRVTKNLFQTACLNSKVTKCMLLSGDSIPLCPFNEVYERAMSSGPERGTLGLSKLMMKDDKMQLRNSTHRRREKTVNCTSWPSSWPWQWQGHSQWIILPIKHVQVMVDHFHILQAVFENSEIPDEHALGVFFNGVGMLDELRDPHFMFADWDTTEDDNDVPPFETCPECLVKHGEMGSNPRTRRGQEITPAFIADIRRNEESFRFTMFRKICPRSPIPYNSPWLRNYKCGGDRCRESSNRYPYSYFRSHGEDDQLFCPTCDD
jgi:hypothetical protein